jgi:phosphoserine phosphatase
LPLDPPYERIVFDCDSTLSAMEGIDELCAAHPETREQIEALTNAAMSGQVPLEEVYGKRLELVSPRQIDVMRVGSLYIQRAVPGARELVAGLRSLGKEVIIISGGLHLAVVAFATWLGLRDQQVHAVKIFFEGDGSYHDFDRKSPLARSDGKIEVLSSLPKKKTVFVGDGMTDAAARGAVDAFVCYGGVALRDEVAALADEVVTAAQLPALLPVLCSAGELERLSRDPRHGRLMTLAQG